MAPSRKPSSSPVLPRGARPAHTVDSGWRAALWRGGQSAQRERERVREKAWGWREGRGERGRQGERERLRHGDTCLCPSRGARAEEAETLSESTAARQADADGGRCSLLSMPLLRTSQLLTHLLPSLLTEPRLEDGDDRTLAIRPANLVEAPKISGDLGEVTQPRRRSAKEEGRGGGRGAGGQANQAQPCSAAARAVGHGSCGSAACLARADGRVALPPTARLLRCLHACRPRPSNARPC